MHKHTHSLILSIRPLRYTEMMSKSIDQGTAEMAMTRMNNHSSLLIKDKYVIIFMNYIQRNSLRQNFKTTTLIWHDKSHDIARADNIVSLDDLVIHANILSLDCQLDTMTRGILHMSGKILIHTHRNLSGCNIKAIMLEHFLLFILIRYLITGLH